jgi:hypothetical protein
LTNSVLRSICAYLIRIGRKGVVPSPDLAELIHYATCPRCIKLLSRQGCFVFVKREDNRILEVTFASKKQHDRILNSFMDEDDEEDGELETENHTRLSIGEGTPKRPKADFYIA